jgi:hypothetical protein
LFIYFKNSNEWTPRTSHVDNMVSYAIPKVC